jgi:glycosyltransferase involved in cell wall biosynthesis
MPGKTDNIPDASYIHMGFGEGWQFSYLIDFWCLYLYLRIHRKDVDLVHFYSTTLILFGPIAAYFAGIRSVVTLTGFGRVFTSANLVNKLLKPLYKLFLGISIRLSLLYFFQNWADLRLLSLRYPKQVNKFFFVGSAVDFPRIGKKEFSVQKLKVILVARLMPDKGINDFIRVAETLNGASWEFILIGPPSKGFNDLYKQVVGCDNRGIISYKGECSTKEVEKELAKAHIFYFPSSYGEGMSRTMLEAGFSLLCPIAYDIPANRDLIASGRGFLLSAGDVNKVISTLKNLLSNRDVLMSNAHAYQDFVLHGYNTETYSKRMDDLILDKIIQPRRNLDRCEKNSSDSTI